MPQAWFAHLLATRTLKELWRSAISIDHLRAGYLPHSQFFRLKRFAKMGLFSGHFYTSFWVLQKRSFRSLEAYYRPHWRRTQTIRLHSPDWMQTRYVWWLN
jgi:hypothetical protein